MSSLVCGKLWQQLDNSLKEGEREIRQPGVHALLDSQHAISTTIQYAEYTVYTNNSSWGLSNSNIHHFLLEVQLSIETILIIKD